MMQTRTSEDDLIASLGNLGNSLLADLLDDPPPPDPLLASLEAELDARLELPAAKALPSRPPGFCAVEDFLEGDALRKRGLGRDLDEVPDPPPGWNARPQGASFGAGSAGSGGPRRLGFPEATPFGRPLVGHSPFGSSLLGQSSLGQSPLILPPMGQPPMGQVQPSMGQPLLVQPSLRQGIFGDGKVPSYVAGSREPTLVGTPLRELPTHPMQTHPMQTHILPPMLPLKQDHPMPTNILPPMLPLKQDHSFPLLPTPFHNTTKPPPPQNMVPLKQDPPTPKVPPGLHPPTRLFNNPHPSAPLLPIPKCSLMPPRDLSYVVNSILRSIPSTGTNPSGCPTDRHFNLADPRKKGKNQTPEEFHQLRTASAKEWKVEKKVLGHVLKTDVTRPRALLDIATVRRNHTPNADLERIAAWKARGLVDRLYPLLYGTQVPLETGWIDTLWSMEKGRVLLSRLLLKKRDGENRALELLLDCREREGEERLWVVVGTRVVSRMPAQDVFDVVELVAGRPAELRKFLLTRVPRVRVLHALMERGKRVCPRDRWNQVEGDLARLLA